MSPAQERFPTRRQLLRSFGAVTAGACAAGALAACTGGSGGRPDRPSAASTSSGGSDARTLDVVDFGARGDGRTDDLAAIRAALAALRSGDTLSFPSGRVFAHSQVLTVSTPDVHLTGTATLRATAEEQSALRIEAARVTVSGITLAVASTTKRWSAPDQHKLYLGPYPGIVVRDVTITGSAAAGLFCDGTSNFTLDRAHVSDTRADGIHMTGGSNHGTVTAPVITRSGDDGVAVVSYLDDHRSCHHIDITRPVVRTTTGGRGVSVVGGHDVHYSDVDITGSAAASVYLACEGGDFVTYPTLNASVLRGRVTDANTDAAIDHGAVLVYSGRQGGAVSDVTVADLAISGTRPSASRQVGVVADSGADAASGIVFRDLRLAASPKPYQGNAARTSFALDGVTAAGTPVQVPS